MILDSLLLRTRGQHSYMMAEDTIQTVLPTVYSRASCSSRCVREYLFHRDRYWATLLFRPSSTFSHPQLRPSRREMQPAIQMDVRNMPNGGRVDMWLLKLAWSLSVLGQSLTSQSRCALSPIYQNLVFYPYSFQSLIILASLCSVQLWELADHWWWIQLRWLLPQHRRFLRECRNCRGEEGYSRSLIMVEPVSHFDVLQSFHWT